MRPKARFLSLSRSFGLAGACFIALSFASFGAQAQATRTWVSGVGDDANPCSRTAPCKTFAGAISKTAAAGEINSLDPGGFGAVAITKSITIDGSGGNAAGILVNTANGITVSAGANDTVILRNLNLTGLGTGVAGVNIKSARLVVLENLKIQGFEQAVNIASTTPVAVSMRNLDIAGSFNYGTGGVVVSAGGVAAPAQVQLDNVRVQGYNGAPGVLLNVGATANVSVQNSQVLNNSIGIQNLDPASKVFVSGSTFFGNGSAFNVLTGVGGPITSFNNNRLEGNTNPSSPTNTVYER